MATGSSVRRRDVLENTARRCIYDAICGAPGIYFNELKRRTDMLNGTLSYHLRILEKTGYVRSKRGGRHLFLYPVNALKL